MKKMIRISASLLVLGFSMGAAREMPVEDFPACHQLTRKGIEQHLEEKLGVKFGIPSPMKTDGEVDENDKLPFAWLPVEGGKVCVAKPFVNPWDGNGTVEWKVMLEPADLMRSGMMIALTLDEKGEFWSIVIHQLSIDGRWEDDERHVSQINRDDKHGEAGPVFFQRAMQTYRERAKNAGDPRVAGFYLAAIEKVAVTVQKIRSEQK